MEGYYFVYFRGPHGSEGDYIHSEGACCVCEEEPYHKFCTPDYEYTLRKALQTFKFGNICLHPEEWCGICQGYRDGCIFCHTAKELLDGVPSQRRQAFDVMQVAWGWDKPLPKQYQMTVTGDINYHPFKPDYGPGCGVCGVYFEVHD